MEVRYIRWFVPQYIVDMNKALSSFMPAVLQTCLRRSESFRNFICDTKRYSFNKRQVKKLAVFIVLFFSVGYSYSQCKTVKDDFTNEIITRFDWADWNTEKFTVSFEFKNNDGSLTLGFLYNGRLEPIIPKGTDVLFKLGNGEILKFQLKSDAVPKYYTIPVVVSQYHYSFPIAMADVEKLLNGKVDKIRLPDPSKPEATLDTGIFNKGMRKGAECLLKK